MSELLNRDDDDESCGRYQKILYPSSSITPGWQRVTLTLRDGKVTTGRLLGSPSANPIRLFDDQGQFRAIPVAKVAQQSLQTTSDMPEGLGDGLTPEQFLDLIEALSSLKKTAAAQ